MEIRDVFGILITGNEQLKKYGLYIEGNVYLVVMKNAPHPENAKSLLNSYADKFKDYMVTEDCPLWV